MDSSYTLLTSHFHSSRSTYHRAPVPLRMRIGSSDHTAWDNRPVYVNVGKGRLGGVEAVMVVLLSVVLGDVVVLGFDEGVPVDFGVVVLGGVVLVGKRGHLHNRVHRRNNHHPH